MIDLQLHTTDSDGTWPWDQVLDACFKMGLAAYAITDHDTMAGVDEAVATGRAIGVRVIPGIELSIKVPHGSMHLLGYFHEPAPEPLAGLIAGFGDIRHQDTACDRSIVTAVRK